MLVAFCLLCSYHVLNMLLLMLGFTSQSLQYFSFCLFFISSLKNYYDSFTLSGVFLYLTLCCFCIVYILLINTFLDNFLLSILFRATSFLYELLLTYYLCFLLSLFNSYDFFLIIDFQICSFLFHA